MDKIRKKIEILHEKLMIDIAFDSKKFYHIKFDICSRCLNKHDVVVLERGDFCPDCLQKIIKDLEDENRKLKGGLTKN